MKVTSFEGSLNCSSQNKDIRTKAAAWTAGLMMRNNENLEKIETALKGLNGINDSASLASHVNGLRTQYGLEGGARDNSAHYARLGALNTEIKGERAASTDSKAANTSVLFSASKEQQVGGKKLGMSI